MHRCAIIPAAGRGSRLGLDRPKLFADLGDGLTAWDVLKQKALGVCDHVHVVLAPGGVPYFEEALRSDPHRDRYSHSVQELPTGMGDAVFCGSERWSRAHDILVIWGDQVHVSGATLRATMELQSRGSGVTLPVVRATQPYVEYLWQEEKLEGILQSREGDICSPNGLGDTGTFALSVDGLLEHWWAYRAEVQLGPISREVNFLPFLVYLSKAGWTIRKLVVEDANAARGINTREDLEFFRSLYRSMAKE